MICPNCQTENPEGAKFCMECGTALPAPCPNCGHQNPPGARFCNECGTKLSGSPRRDARSEPHAPDKARTASRPVESSERRIVTALFCDLSGSTSAADHLDPEEWTEIMNGAFEQMIDPIRRYDGTVVRLLGDAVLAFFGAPVAHEDDPERAVRAGLEIQESMSAYLSRVRSNWGVDLNVRCGINTGLAVVGAVGSEDHVEYTALGDAVNVAARMEQTAQPGAVQISDATYRLLAPLVDVERLGGIEVKGKPEPVSAYNVLGMKATPGRLRGIQGREAGLVGREAELARLQEADARLRQGAGSIAFLTGEAGLGKSRLVRELKIRSSEDYPDTLWYSASCQSYEMARPYGLFQRLMRDVCAIGEDASVEEIHRGIAGVVERTPIEQREPTRKVLETLFDVTGDVDGAPRLEGETFKGQLYVTMHALWSAWASASPVILVLDDLHWADPASIELLAHLLTLVDQVPILFICAMRPDSHAPGWSLKIRAQEGYANRYLEIKLNALSPQESDLLIDQLMSADLPGTLRERLLEKSAGNPLFVEEVVRALIDSGAVTYDQDGDRWQAERNLDNLYIPDNVQSLMMARIDRLDQQARQTLQLGSVIGRSFYFRVLRAISEQDQTMLDEQVGALQQNELIQEAARQPELVYVFRHVLMQETAYATILHRQRREFHQRVAEAMETLFPEHLEENAAVLAHHYDQARRFERAIHYHRLAGDAAYRLYSLEEAIGHYDRALELALNHDTGDLEISDDRLQHLFLGKGRALELRARFPEAVATYEEMSETGNRRSSRSLQLASLLARGTIYSTITPVADSALGKTVDDEALALARELGDPQSQATALWNLMNLENFHLGNMQAAVRYGEEALSIALQHELQEPLAYIQNDLHWIYIHLGDLPRAWALLDESRERWRELGNLPMLADNLFGSATYYVFTGELDKALEVTEEGAEIAESIRNVWNHAALRGTMAMVYRLRGEYGPAIASLEETARLIDDGSPGIHASFLSMLVALLYAELGMVKRGLDLFERTQRRFEHLVLPFRMRAYHAGIGARLHLLDGDVEAAGKTMQEGTVDTTGKHLFSILGHFNPFVMCELALAEDDFARAKQLAQEFFVVYEKTGARWALPEFRYLAARAMLSLGDNDGAEHALLQARAEAEEMDLRRIHWPILLALAKLETGRGEQTTAGELRETAARIREHIAAGLPEGELRTAFLASAEE